MILILLGAPGAGKGTQAQMLSKHLDLRHLSTGDLLRAAVADDTPLGQAAREYMDVGKLVPDEIITGIVLDYLASHQGEKVLLDGFPRTVPQAEGLAKAADNDLHLISLEVPDREVIARLSSRRVCGKCGKVYNPALGLQAPGGKCECGGELIHRPDDKPQTIAHRLEVYHDQTKPVIAFYENRGRVNRVNGLGTPDEVFQRVKATLD